MSITPPTPEDLRAAIARRRVRLYHLAPVIEMHPSRLSVLLSGRVPIPPDVAARILRAVESWPAPVGASRRG